MKTIFIMGILSFFCGISAAQPQYWGEGAYDLENVVFGMNVDKYYSRQGYTTGIMTNHSAIS